MKKHILMLIILILSLAACATEPAITVTFLPSAAAAPAEQSVIPSASTASCSAVQSVPPEPTASPSAVKSVSPAPTASPAPARDITVIIAASNTPEAPHGEIRGGYSNGKWLTHNEAAKYCKGEMTFSEYNLVDYWGKVNSSGVTENGEEDSVTLNIPEGDNIENDYEKDALCFSYLYYGAELPEIKIISDTSKAKRAVQNLLDKELGKGEAKANIRIAVSADIDNDGKKEIVVNADFVSGFFDDGPDTKYCLCCIIESDGTLETIGYYYDIPTSADPAWYFEGVFYVQNIIDIDGDGISELVVDETLDVAATLDTDEILENSTGFSVYKYNGEYAEKIMDYDGIYDIF